VASFEDKIGFLDGFFNIFAENSIGEEYRGDGTFSRTRGNVQIASLPQSFSGIGPQGFGTALRLKKQDVTPGRMNYVKKMTLSGRNNSQTTMKSVPFHDDFGMRPQIGPVDRSLAGCSPRRNTLKTVVRGFYKNGRCVPNLSRSFRV